MLKLGKSQPWMIALSELTDGRIKKLDAKPMLRYFRKLHEWLKQVNRDEDIGWCKSMSNQLKNL